MDEIEIREHTGISWSHNRSRLPLMLKNVAYIGDCITDNYYTAYSKDGHRYSKRNLGERDQYLIEQHHEAIISREQLLQGPDDGTSGPSSDYRPKVRLTAILALDSFTIN